MGTRLTLFSIVLISLLSSCAYHNGSMSGTPYSNNMQYVDLAVGKATTRQVFWLGGLNQDALVMEAKRNMFQNYPLLKGQYYGNITTDKKFSLYIIYNSRKVTVSADILCNDCDTSGNVYSANYLNKLYTNNYKKALYLHGDSIYIFQSLHTIIPGVVLDVKPKQITVLKNAQNGALRSMAKQMKYIYSRRIDSTVNSKRLITGDSVNLPPDKKYIIGTDQNGRIIGVNETNALVRFYKNKTIFYFSIPFYALKKI